MNFLFQAIKRRVCLIGATLLLAFVFLEFYCVYIYMGGQYLGGY